MEPKVRRYNHRDTNTITYQSLLDGNKSFVQEALSEDPEYFKRLAAGQTPPVLWIGCADSRVPADQITQTNPGEIFVHRNIANVVINTDMSLLSVLDYAVNVLKVKHVIVVGHYGCGGVNAALTNKEYGLIDNWLRHIKDVYRLHADELDTITDEKAKSNRLVEFNVMEGVYNLSKTTIIQNTWKDSERELFVHGWVYDLATGIVKDLEVSRKDNTGLAEVFRFEV